MRANALAAGLQIAATTLKIYALIIIVTSALACVRPINAGVRARACVCVCVCACCARLRADVRTDESDGQETAVCEESKEAPPDTCEEGPRGLLRRGAIPTVQDGHLAFLHRSGHDRTASREINHRSKFRIYVASSYANVGPTDSLDKPQTDCAHFYNF